VLRGTVCCFDIFDLRVLFSFVAYFCAIPVITLWREPGYNILSLIQAQSTSYVR
jgi:hypothetical protein